MNVITRLDFELAYYDVAVQNISRYAMRTSPVNLWYDMQTKQTLFHLLQICPGSAAYSSQIAEIW